MTNERPNRIPDDMDPGSGHMNNDVSAERQRLNNHCIEWGGHRVPKGYGRTGHKWNGTQEMAHRWAYRKFFGHIPKGMFVLHKCDNPPCINPLHLWLGTNTDNINDMVSKGRHHEQRRTHCFRGHVRSEENLAVRQGKRRCLVCIRVKDKLRKRWLKINQGA